MTMTVLLVCAVNGHGGPIQSLASVVEHADGVETVAATQLATGTRKRSAIELATDRQIEMPRPRGWGLLRAQWALLRRGRWVRRDVGVIHANGLTEAAVVAPVALLTATPVIVWVHNFQRPRVYALLEPLLRRQRRWGWLAVSELAAEQVRGIEVENVPNPIGDDVVGKRAASHDSEPHVPIVSFLAGSDRPYKGFDLLPAIIAAAGAGGVCWRIYTSPPFSSKDPASRRAWVSFEAMNDDRVEILGRTRDVASAYASSDLVIAPSRLESFNRVIVEAFANGVPVVASDIGPHCALVAESGAGVVFRSEDAAAAGAAVRALVDDPPRRAAMGVAARQFATRFEAGRIAEAIQGHWRSAAGIGER